MKNGDATEMVKKSAYVWGLANYGRCGVSLDENKGKELGLPKPLLKYRIRIKETKGNIHDVHDDDSDEAMEEGYFLY